MDRSVLEIDTKSPFGTYKLDARQKLAAALVRKTTSKPVINLLRQLGGLRNCKVADVEVYGGQMRVYPGLNRSDKIMLGMPHVFDLRERTALAEHLKSTTNNSFLDVGANIGAYSLFVSGLNLGTKIIAIEADPEMFGRLSFNSPQSITRLNIAVGAEEGILPFYIHETNRGENSLIDTGGKKIEVPAKRLLQVLDENGINQPGAMKIDVEGAEFPILQKFYEEAPQSRWPELVIMEHIHSKDALDLVLSKGYTETLRTKLNIVLSLI